jgi:hypothetical protein
MKERLRMFDDPGITVETREIAEFTARMELEAMEEDPTARAERHLKGEHTYKTVAILQEEIKTLKDENAKLTEKVRRRSTTLTKRLERNTFWTKVCCILVVMALVGPTDKVAAFVLWLLEKATKGKAQ